MGEFYNRADDDQDGAIVQEGAPTAGQIAILNSSEIDQQIATARRFPRSLTDFRKEVMQQVTLDPVIAAKCQYALPRGRGADAKVIEGPSVRFAEIIRYCWGNNRAAARVVDIGDKYITAQGLYYDLEKNSAVTYEVLRRITNSKGERYNDDMIGVTGNAACAIAIRNAITRGIPQAFWAEHLEAAKRVVAGDVKTLNSRRATMLNEFMIMGVRNEQVFGLLGVKGVDDISIDNLVVMNGVFNSIKDSVTTIEAAFAPEEMKNPDHATPPRPNRSEFERDGSKDKAPRKSRSKKADAAKSSPAGDKPSEPTQASPADAATGDGKVEKAKEPVASSTANPSPGAPEIPEDATEPLKRGLDILARTKKTNDVADLRGTIKDELTVMGELEIWDKACDARSKEILGGGK